MVRLLVHVEGPTEETFVNEALAPYLYDKGYSLVSARIVGNSRRRAHRGGICGWPVARRDIVNHLREDTGCIATTMVDYYALPAQGVEAWPQRAVAPTLPFKRRAAAVEDGLLADVGEQIGNTGGNLRFVPYVVMHEFEGLLFSDCEAFARGIGRSSVQGQLQAVRDAFASPEEINDSVLTAPSKRVQAIMPDYEKPLFGTLAALEVTVGTMRMQCRGFDSWLTRLEARVVA